MPPAEQISRLEDLDAQLNYVEQGASIMRRFITTGNEVNTFGYEAYPVRIRNARPHRERFTLDRAGFELLDHRSAVSDFLDERQVAAVYPEEAIALVKRATGASSVFVTNWNLRSTDDAEVHDFRASGRLSHTGRMQPPGQQVHIDHYPPDAERVANALYAERAPDGPGYSRFICFSLWRTFSEPPQDQPLAMSEFPSIDENEGLRNALVFCDEIPDETAMRAPIEGEDRLKAATLFKFNPRHRWWYFPDMHRDEAVLLKFHDSDKSVAWRVPHTAFTDRSIAHPNIRRSIELRCTAYFEH